MQQENQKKPFVDLNTTNPCLKRMESDYLYHLEMGTETYDLQKKFGDVKFVCMGGTKHRMETFAKYIQKELGFPSIEDLSSGRFTFYKIGPVISVSHGMGMGSVSILLHEIIKLMHYAKCMDPIFIRIGTCGGIGVEPGTVIVTKDAFNGLLENVHEFMILGKRVKRAAKLDIGLTKKLLACSEENDKFKIILGNTVATDDFYEAQGRTDGAICEHTEDDKMNFLNLLYDKEIRNMEMEATVFAALTHFTGIKAADLCVALVNRREGDQVTITKEMKDEMETRPQIIVGRFIKKYLKEMTEKIIFHK